MSASPSETEQSKAWNGAAGEAWVDLQETLDDALRPFEGILSAFVEPGMNVLDIGCGAGATSIAAGRRLSGRGRCLGVDISAPLVAAARSRAAREGVAVDFVCADAQSYPFEPQTFDLILSRFGVMFFEDPVRAFENLRGAVRTNGRLRFVAWRSPEDNPFMTVAERAAIEARPELVVQTQAPTGQFAFADPTRVSAILKDAGWSDVELRPLDVACEFPEAQLVPYFSRLGPLGRALPLADARTRADIVRRVRAAFDPFVHDDKVRFRAACWLASARAPGA